MVDNSQHLFSRLLPLFRYPIVQLPIGILKLNVCLHPLGWHRFHFSLRPSDTPARIQLIRISQFEKKNCAWRRVPGTIPRPRRQTVFLCGHCRCIMSNISHMTL